MRPVRLRTLEPWIMKGNTRDSGLLRSQEHGPSFDLSIASNL